MPFNAFERMSHIVLATWLLNCCLPCNTYKRTSKMLCPRCLGAVSSFRMRTRARSQLASDYLRFINLTFLQWTFPRFVDWSLDNHKSSNCYLPWFGRKFPEPDLVTHLIELPKSPNNLMRAEMGNTTIEKSPVGLVPIARDKTSQLVLHLAHFRSGGLLPDAHHLKSLPTDQHEDFSLAS